MGLFDKIKEPVFLKDSTKDEKIVKELEEIENLASEDDKNQIKQEIKRIKYGISGEKKIEFELKNSHIPMFVIHDLYLEHAGLKAQIDYLVLTKRRNFVIECKNFYGNLTICDNGDFVRTVTKNGMQKKQRVYSPITQNKRHLELIKAIRLDEKNNFITKAIFEKYFYETYRPIVVLANYKGFLNTKYAPKDVAKQVINADQLIDYIQKVNNEDNAENCFEKYLQELADFFMQQDKENPTEYLKKYKKLIKTPNIPCYNTNLKNQSISDTSFKNALNKQSLFSKAPVCKRCGAPMVKRIAKRGDNKGNEFWGCSRYPKCRFIIDDND